MVRTIILGTLLLVFGGARAAHAVAGDPIYYVPGLRGYCVPTNPDRCHHYGNGAPQGVEQALHQGDTYQQIDVLPNKFFDFTGTAPGTQGWVERTGPAAVVCGDGTLSPSETCEPNVAAGACGTIANCGSDCQCLSPTCSTASTCPGGATVMDCLSGVCVPKCGNGTLDAGEGCDVSADAFCLGSPTVNVGGVDTPRCTAACKCLATCQDGLKQTGTPGGSSTDENCEFTGVNFGNAALFAPNACSSTGNGCATIKDTAGASRTTWDFPGAVAMTVMVKFAPSAPTGATQRLLYNGGNNDTTVGYTIQLDSSGHLQAALSPTAAADTNTLTLTGTTVIGTNEKRTAFLRKASDGRAVDIWMSGVATGTVSQQASGTLSVVSEGPSAQFSLGGTATSSGPYQGGYIEEVAAFNRQLSEGEMNALVNDPATTTLTGLVLLLDFNEAIGSANVTDKSATAATFHLYNGSEGSTPGPGTVVLDASPWTTGTSTTACTTACGCTAPQECNPGSCRCQDPSGGGGGRTFYVASAAELGHPAGNNASYPCTSASAPCADANYVLNKARAQVGDTVVLLDNTDANPHASISLTCGSDPGTGGVAPCNGTGSNAICGTQQNHITIKCQNSRQCTLARQGNGNNFFLGSCEWYDLNGLAGRGQDDLASTGNGDHTFYFANVRNIYGYELLVDRNNSCGNNHVISIERGTDMLFERLECMRNSRHCVRRNNTRRVKVRQSYFNNAGRVYSCDSIGGPTSPPGGTSHEVLSSYPGNDGLDENNLIEGSQAWGYTINGTPGLGGIRGSSNNRAIGTIIAGAWLGIKIHSRENDCQGIFSNLLEHFIVKDITTSFGIRDSTSVNTIFDHFTIMGGVATSGIRVDDPDPTATTCGGSTTALACSAVTAGPVSVEIRKTLITGNAGTDLDIQACDASATRKCTLTDVISDSCSSMASGCAGSGGDQCLCSGTNSCNGTGIPSDLGDSGANKCVTKITGSNGARVVCKSVDGVTGTTSADNLWYQTGDTTPGGVLITSNAGCDATPPAGPVQGCRGGFKLCGPVRVGWNDGSLTGGQTCRNFASRRLNQKPDNSGCPAASVACP